MPRERVNLRKVLPPGFAAVHTTQAGRKGATRWMIYNPNDVFIGDLVRWRDRGVESWSWQPYTDGPYRDGTLEECVEVIKQQFT